MCRSNKVPLYHQVALLLRTEIAEGVYEVGTRIPIESDLGQRFSVSRITIRQAVENLVQDGILERKQGRGTFVLATPRRDTVTELAGTLDVVDSLAENTEVRLIATTFVVPPPSVARQLHMDRTMDDTALQVIRVRSAHGLPFEYLTNWVAPPWSTRVNLDALKVHSLVGALKQTGGALDAADQVISATLATPEIGTWLEAPAGSPLLKGYRVYYAQGQPLMILESLYRPDRYAYRVRLSLKAPQLSELWVGLTDT